MTLHERERELEALDLDAESIGFIVAELDTQRLFLFAEAIRLELGERAEGKPLERFRYH